MTSPKRWRDRPRCRWCNNWFTRAKPTDRLCSAQCKRLEGLARQMGLTRRQVGPDILAADAGRLFAIGFWSDVRKRMEQGVPAVRAFVMGDEFGAWVDVTAVERDDALREGLLARWNAGGTEEE